MQDVEAPQAREVREAGRVVVQDIKGRAYRGQDRCASRSPLRFCEGWRTRQPIATCTATLRTVTMPAFRPELSGTKMASIAEKTAGTMIRHLSLRAATPSQSMQVSARSRRPAATAA